MPYVSAKRSLSKEEVNNKSGVSSTGKQSGKSKKMRQLTWKSARSFDDFRALNERFIEGNLDKTPYHLGPLIAESELIKEDLLALCQDAKVMTMSSQPRGVFSQRNAREIRIQRAYVNGVWRGSLDEFVERIRPTGLSYIVCSHDSFAKSNDLPTGGRWGVTKVGDEVVTGIWLSSPHEMVTCGVEFYKTRCYNLKHDRSVVTFEVAEPTWPTEEERDDDTNGQSHGQMLRTLRDALIA